MNILSTLNESRDRAAEVYWLPEVRRHVAADVGAEPGPGHVWHVGGGHCCFDKSDKIEQDKHLCHLHHLH